jgi:hypothetical protein
VPLIFPGLVEHELVLIMACFLLPTLKPIGALSSEHRFRWRPIPVKEWAIDLGVALLLGIFALDLMLFYTSEGGDTIPPTTALFAMIQTGLLRLADLGHYSVDTMWKIVVYGVPLLVAITFRNRPRRFGFALAAFLSASLLQGPLPEPGRSTSTVIYRERSFFSVLKVELEAKNSVGQSHVLMHATTLHGQQFTHPRLRSEPLTYYSRSGPVGQVMRAVDESKPHKKFALVGLGSGASACYGHAGDELTGYEIDSAVVHIAEDPEYFTYLADCEKRGCQVRLVVGDARRSLGEAPDYGYDVMILDAFSSDAVPVHLLTREAFELYWSKLATDGYLLVHISNRFLDLEPVIGNIARALGLTAYRQDDDVIDLPGKWASDWIVLVNDAGRMRPLLAKERVKERVPSAPPKADERPAPPQAGQIERVPDEGSHWRPVAVDEKMRVWTDDYSNLLSVFRPR